MYFILVAGKFGIRTITGRCNPPRQQVLVVACPRYVNDTERKVIDVRTPSPEALRRGLRQRRPRNLPPGLRHREGCNGYTKYPLQSLQSTISNPGG